MTEPSRQVQGCHVCEQVDDHPRHIIYAASVHPVTLQPRDDSIVKHLDCCAADGCEICATHLEFAGNKRGPALIEHMTNLPPEHVQALFERHGVETENFQVR